MLIRHFGSIFHTSGHAVDIYRLWAGVPFIGLFIIDLTMSGVDRDQVRKCVGVGGESGMVIVPIGDFCLKDI